MEVVKDFFAELKDRASNPLISSFCIAWLVYNWQIPVVLFMYDYNDLRREHSYTHIQFINNYATCWNIFVIPFIIALAYTFIMPRITAFIKLYKAGIEAKNETDILDKTKAGWMPIHKYVSLKNSLSSAQETLKGLIDTQGQTAQDNLSLQQQMAILRNEINDVNLSKMDMGAALAEWEEWSSARTLIGKWKCNYDGSIWVIEERQLKIAKDIYSLRDLNFNAKELSYAFMAATNDKLPITLFLKYNSESGGFVGIQDGFREIELSRYERKATLTEL